MFALVRLFALLCLALVTASCGENKHHHAGLQNLVVGMMSGYAPFMIINKHGEYEGFDIDVANKLAEKMGKKLVVKDMSLASLFVSLEQGRVDCIISGLGITQGRKQEVAMVHYQGENITHLPLAFWKQAPAGIKTFDDLVKFGKPTICVEAGSSMEGVFKHYPFITPRLMDRYVEMVLDVQYGKSLAVLLEPSTVGKLTEMFPELVTIDLPLPADCVVEGNGIAVKKDNHELVTQIEGIIADMKRDGTIKEYEQKWKLS